jgi:hypothetical protein
MIIHDMPNRIKYEVVAGRGLIVLKWTAADERLWKLLQIRKGKNV